MLEADPLLGKVIGNYPSDRMRLLIPAVVVCGVVAVALNFTIADIPGWGPLVTVVVMGVVTMVMGWRALHFWNREIILFEHGFSYREGANVVYFLYHEIRSIRQHGERLAYFGGLLRRTVFRFTLKTIRDETMTLTNLYRHIDQLVERIEQKVYPLLEPYVAELLAKGEKVAFSDTLQVSSAGLSEGGRDLAWDAFAGYKIGGGRLTVFAHPGQTEWLSLPLPEIDNIPLLINLLKAHQSLSANRLPTVR